MSANVAICIISGVMEFDGVLARWQGDEWGGVVIDLQARSVRFLCISATNASPAFCHGRLALNTVLLDKLSNLGILDKEHGWFTDYLSNRTQVVEFQGVTSASEAVSTGVPQGSILGPLLFILHINDLPEVVSDCNILMYADDTVLYCSSSQASVIQDKLNAELCKIDHWLYFNSLLM